MSTATHPTLHLPHSEYKSAIQNLQTLLTAVDASRWNLYLGPALQRAIWRYENCWLPLHAAISNLHVTDPDPQPPPIRVRHIAARLTASDIHLQIPHFHPHLLPPLDVAWVWYLHRLSARSYLRDVQRYVGPVRIPDRHIAFRFAATAGSAPASQRLWHAVFPHEAYYPSYLDPDAGSGRFVSRIPRDMLFASDISKSARMHRGVLVQLVRHARLLPYADMVLMYERFLVLASLYDPYDDVVLEPNGYQDVVWRAHVACTKEYVADKLSGGGRPHVQMLRVWESISDAEEALMARREMTARLWFDAFGCEVGPLYSSKEFPGSGGAVRIGLREGGCMERLVVRWEEAKRDGDCSECGVFGSEKEVVIGRKGWLHFMVSDEGDTDIEMMEQGGQDMKFLFTKLTKRMKKYEYKRHKVRILITVCLLAAGCVSWALGVSMMREIQDAGYGVVTFYFGSVMLVAGIAICATEGVEERGGRRSV